MPLPAAAAALGVLAKVGRARVLLRLAAGVVAFVLVLVLVVVMLFHAGGEDDGCLPTVATGGDPNVPRPVTNTGKPVQVTVATWNTLYSNTTGDVIAGLRVIAAAGADVIGMQEMSSPSRRRAVERAMAKLGFAMTGGGPDRNQRDEPKEGNNAVPILYRTDKYERLSADSSEVFGVRRIEGGGAAGSSIGPKNIQHVVLRDRSTGGEFAVVNHHLVPSIETKGRPDPQGPTRVKLAVQQLDAAASLTDQLGGANVAITSDWNIDARKDARVKDPRFPYVRLAKSGLYSNWRALGYPKGGTHDKTRLIDAVFSTTRTLAPVSQRILKHSIERGDRFYGSDHSPALATLSNRATSSQPQPSTQQQPPVAAISGNRPAPAAITDDPTRQKQIENARKVEQGVREAGGSGRAVYVALVAAVGESDLINVDYGDRAGPDSRGLFQQRLNWGSYEDRMNPVEAAKMFMLGPHKRGQGGLLDLAGWESMPVTTAIHRVQINADPNHYSRFESRAREIGTQAGVDFDAPAGAAPGPTSTGDSCVGVVSVNEPAMPGLGSGPCPLDQLYAVGRQPGRDCNGALQFMQQQMTSGSRAWYRRCLALVMQSYGYSGGAPTAFAAAQEAAAGGRLNKSRTNIPRGAILYWDGRPVGNNAGHVAIYDGQGFIYSNDVTGAGRVGRVPWDFPETNWNQTWLGWSPPYFPTGVGGGNQ